MKESVIDLIKNIVLPELREIRNRQDAVENKVDGFKSELQGLRDKVDGVVAFGEAIRLQNEVIKMLLDELKNRKNGA